jgi:hypothetical protein
MRFGRFRVPNRELVHASMTDKFDIVDLYYEGMIVTRAECVFSSDCVEVTAMSKLFDKIDTTGDIPLYHIDIKVEVDDNNEPIGYSRTVRGAANGVHK